MPNDKTFFAIVFWTAIAIPAIFVLTVGGGHTALEARRPADFPELNLETLQQVETFHGISAAIKDRVPLRTQLVGVRSRLARVGLIPNPFDQVVLGHGDWLYIAEGFNPHCPADAREAIVANLDATARLLASHGIELIVIMVPNKASMHPEAIPDWIAPDSKRALEATASVRHELGSHEWFIDLWPPMNERRSRQPDQPLYYAGDTHWTWAGAEVFVEHLLERLQPGLYDPAEVVVASQEPTHLDLDRLSGSDRLRPFTRMAADRAGVRQTLETVQHPLPATVVDNEAPPGRTIAGRTVLIRDSFWDMIAPVGQAYFSHLISIHATHANSLPGLAEAIASADRVIIESGERKFCEVLLQTLAAPEFRPLMEEALADRVH